jgi:hypothetical protein
MGASRSVLKSVVDSVIARHRDARLPSPVSGHMSYFRLTRCLGRLLGSQHPHNRFIAPSRPSRSDQAVNAHTTRAPAPPLSHQGGGA